jgi:hypothetical protein
MNEICFLTPLGGHSSVTGTEIVLEVMEKKPALQAAIEPRSSEEAPERDNGDIPGDHLGWPAFHSFLKLNFFGAPNWAARFFLVQYPKMGGNVYTRLPQNIPNDHKLPQMAVK